MSLEMGAEFAASVYISVRIFLMYDMYLYVIVLEVNYNQCEDKLI